MNNRKLLRTTTEEEQKKIKVVIERARENFLYCSCCGKSNTRLIFKGSKKETLRKSCLGCGYDIIKKEVKE